MEKHDQNMENLTLPPPFGLDIAPYVPHKLIKHQDNCLSETKIPRWPQTLDILAI